MIFIVSLACILSSYASTWPLVDNRSRRLYHCRHHRTFIFVVVVVTIVIGSIITAVIVVTIVCFAVMLIVVVVTMAIGAIITIITAIIIFSPIIIAAIVVSNDSLTWRYKLWSSLSLYLRPTPLPPPLRLRL